MSKDILEQTQDELLNAFYPDAESEPQDTPTDEAIEKDAPEEAEAEEAEEEAEGEEDAEEEGEESEEEEGDILVYEINGKEYTAERIEELEAGELRQSDYTKKTQNVARELERAEEDRKLLGEALTTTKNLAAELEVLVAEDKEIDWDFLEEDDPEEYIKQKRKADLRADKLSKVKAEITPTVKFDPDSERKKLVESNPLWVADGKPTDLYKSDMENLTAYYEKQNITQEEAQFISQNAKVAQLFIEEARRAAKSTKEAVKVETAKKKIIKSPKIARPKAQTNILSAEERFYGKQ